MIYSTNPPGAVSPQRSVKRKRKGKKSRIAIRKKLAESHKRELADQKRQMEKETAEAQKRRARNREKKLKRRQNKREVKAAEISRSE